MGNYKTVDSQVVERLQKEGFKVIGMTGKPKEYEFAADWSLVEEFLSKMPAETNPEPTPATENKLELKAGFPFFKKKGRPKKEEVK